MDINNYHTFSYNSDFTPLNNVFNVNSIRGNVGIGTNTPNNYLEVKGNTSTSNLLINGNFNLQHSINPNYISLLSLNNDNKLIYLALNSNAIMKPGIQWSITNNNNINLTLRDIEDNTRLDYFSSIYPIINTNNSFQFIITPQYNLTIRYIHITLISDNSPVTNITNINELNISINGITSFITHKFNGLYKLHNYITLSSNTPNIVTLNNFNTTYNIQLYGLYNYYSGSLWNLNNKDIYINHNIGIHTTNPLASLHVIGNTTINGNLTINNNLNTDYLTTDILQIKGNLNLNYIEPITDYLIINPDKTPVGIGMSNPTDLLHIGSHFRINDNHTFNIHSNINNNITLSTITNNKYSILFNTNKITFKNSTKKLLYENTNNIIITDKLNISYTNITNNNTLYVHGNTTINGNLSVNKIKQNLNSYTCNNNSIYSNFSYINNLFVNGLAYTDNIDTNNIKINNDYPIPNNFSKNSIYYDTTKNIFMYSNNHKFALYNDLGINQLPTTYYDIGSKNFNKIFSYNSVDTKTIQADFINTPKLEITDTIHFLNNSNIYFNNTSLREEINLNSYNTTMFDLSY